MLFTAKHAREMPRVTQIPVSLPAPPMPTQQPLPVWFQDAEVESQAGEMWARHLASRSDSRRPVPPIASYMTSGVTCLTPPLILVDGDTIILETLTKPKMIERVAEFSHLKRKQSLRLFTEGVPVEASLYAPPRVSGDLFLLTSSLTHNYYHWLVEALPRIELWRQLPAGSRLLLKSLRQPFQAESLSVSGVKEEDLRIIRGHAFLEGNIVFADPLALSTTELSPAIVPFYRSLKAKIAPLSTRRRRFLVSRRNASSRRILNEDAIAAALALLGFEVIHIER